MGTRGPPPSPGSVMFTRRTATVIISAPDASCALTMTAGDEYLPVPTMRREEKLLSAIVKVSEFMRLPAAHKVDDFDLIALVHDNFVERPPLEHDKVMLDRDASSVDSQSGKKLAYGKRTRHLDSVAVELDRQESIRM